MAFLPPPAMPSIPNRVTSLVEAQRIIQDLRSYDYHPELECMIITKITTSNWLYFCKAGWLTYLTKRAEKYDESQFIESGGLPMWYNDFQILPKTLIIAFWVYKSGSPQDLESLSRLLAAIIKNYFKPLLSANPHVGLAGLAYKLQTHQNSSPHEEHSCLNVAGRLIGAMNITIKFVPDPSLRRSFIPQATKISLIIWALASTDETREIGRAALLAVINDPNDPSDAYLKDVLTHVMRHVSPDTLANRCKETLCEILESHPSIEPTRLLLLQPVAILCYPAPIPKTKRLITNGEKRKNCIRQLVVNLDQVMVKQNVHHEVMKVAGRLILEAATCWDELWRCSTILWNMITAFSDGDYIPFRLLMEYIEPLGLLSILAGVLTKDPKKEEETNHTWMMMFAIIRRSLNSYKADCECCERPSEYIKIVKAVLERDQLWMKTLNKLRALSNAESDKSTKKRRNQTSLKWLQLGLAAGLQEGQSGIGCQWQNCSHHGRFDDDIEWMLRRCARCQAKRYCSKSCQIADWKAGHKLVCKQASVLTE